MSDINCRKFAVFIPQTATIVINPTSISHNHEHRNHPQPNDHLHYHLNPPPPLHHRGLNSHQYLLFKPVDLVEDVILCTTQLSPSHTHFPILTPTTETNVHPVKDSPIKETSSNNLVGKQHQKLFDRLPTCLTLASRQDPLEVRDPRTMPFRSTKHPEEPVRLRRLGGRGEQRGGKEREKAGRREGRE
eukprot:761673-Hanusia_phi.AAC.1